MTREQSFRTRMTKCLSFLTARMIPGSLLQERILRIHRENMEQIRRETAARIRQEGLTVRDVADGTLRVRAGAR